MTPASGFISHSKHSSHASLRGGRKADEAISEGKPRLLRSLRSLAMTDKGLAETYETASRIPASLFLLLLILAVPDACAYYRTQNTELAAVLPAGRFQLETGLNYMETADETHAVEGIYIPKAGLPGNTEIDLAVPVDFASRYKKEDENGDYAKKATHSGFGDLELLGKWQAVKESRFLPAAAAAGVVRFPSGNPEKGLGLPKAGYRLLAIASKSYRRLAWYGHASWEFVLDGDDALWLSTALEYEVIPKWYAILECDGQTDFVGSSAGDGLGVLAGVYWEINPHVMLDAGVRAGLASEDDRFVLSTGATFTF